MSGLSIIRPAPASLPRGGGFRAGAASVDITPHPGLPLAGYSVGGPRGDGARGRLYARVVVFDDGFGGRIGLIAADLHSGARYLNERTAALVAGTTGLSVDRLVIFGTHTHTGHGGFYGDSFHDRMTADRGDFDRAAADWTAERLADAVRRATAGLHPATLSTATVRAPGVVRNRAMKATLKNPEWPTLPPPGAYEAVDDRVTTWVATPANPADPLIVFGLFGAHATSLGHREHRFEPDWPGRAVARAMRLLVGSGGDFSGVHVALANGSAGDVTPMGFRGLAQSPGLADAVGAAIGDALAHAARTAMATPAQAIPVVAARFDERPWSDSEKFFAKNWAPGHPIIGGSEDGRSGFFTPAMAEGIAAEKDHLRFPEDPLHNPKVPIFDSHFLTDSAKGFLLLEPPRVLTLRILTLGASTLVAVPFEPSVIAARRIERDVAQMIRDFEGEDASRAETVRVVGFAGAYAGYLTTPEEYDVQLYEGAHTLRGRESLPGVIFRCMRLSISDTGPAAGSADFPDVHRNGPQFLFEGDGKREHADWEAQSLEEKNGELSASFLITQNRTPCFADAPWVVIERRAVGAADWRPLVVDGVSADDASGFASVGDRERVHLAQSGIPRAQYRYVFRAPAAGLKTPGFETRLRLNFEAGRRTLSVR